MNICYKKLHEKAMPPKKNNKDDACHDIYNLKEFTIKPGEIKIVGTGIAFEIPKGWEIVIRSRSGLSTKGIVVQNSPGTLDSNFTGEVKIILKNNSKNKITFLAKSRIAQIKRQKVYNDEFIEVPTLKSIGRGDNGLGSSGVK